MSTDMIAAVTSLPALSAGKGSPNMLSLRDCKRYLKNYHYSDKKVEEIRDSLYKLAGIVVDNYLEKEGARDNREVNVEKRSSLVDEAESGESLATLAVRVIDMFNGELVEE